MGEEMKQHYINPAQQVRLWVLGALQLIQLIMLFLVIASAKAAACRCGGTRESQAGSIDSVYSEIVSGIIGWLAIAIIAAFTIYR